MAALANGKVCNKPTRHPKNPNQLNKRKQHEVDEVLRRCREIWISRIRCVWKDAQAGCGKEVYRNCFDTVSNSNIHIYKTLIEYVPRHNLLAGPCHERSLQGYRNQVKECSHSAHGEVTSPTERFWTSPTKRYLPYRTIL